MRGLWLQLVVGSVLIVSVGCGSGSSNPPPPPPPQTVTFTFTNGTATAAAVQTGTGAFASAPLTGNKLTFTVPNGTTKFAVAYVCSPIVIGSPPSLIVTDESIIEATTQDGTAFTADCGNIPATSNVSGSVNSSLIAGTSDVRITGNVGYSTAVGTGGSPFTTNLPTGTNDVAAVALDSSSNALAVRMMRSQTVPGTLNGGSTIILGPSDATTNQSVTVSGLPAGFAAPTEFVDYNTANGTLIVLYNGPATQYRAVPAAIAQSGDFYLYSTGATDIATNSFVDFVQTTNAGGGPISHTLPQPWLYSGPTPAAFPAFTFNYAGFSGLHGGAQRGSITWFTSSSNASSITISATAGFQSGANTLTIPNLTSIPGFLPPANSSTSVSWSAAVYGGPGPSLAFILDRPSNGSISIVQNSGSYTEP
jgi:hypothetical protein